MPMTILIAFSIIITLLVCDYTYVTELKDGWPFKRGRTLREEADHFKQKAAEYRKKYVSMKEEADILLSVALENGFVRRK